MELWEFHSSLLAINLCLVTTIAWPHLPFTTAWSGKGFEIIYLKRTEPARVMSTVNTLRYIYMHTIKEMWSLIRHWPITLKRSYHDLLSGICLDLLGFARICLDLPGFAWIYSDLSCFTQVFPDIVRIAGICLDLPWFARIHPVGFILICPVLPRFFQI